MRALSACLGLGLALSARSQAPYVLPSDDGLKGVFETHDSRPLPSGLFLAGADGYFAGGTGWLRDDIRSPDSAGRGIPAYVHQGRFFLAGGLGAGLDASLCLPIYYQYLSGAENPRDQWGPGDLSAVLKLRLPFAIPIASFSLEATGSLPTSPREGPRFPARLAFQPASGRLPDPVSHGLGQDVPRGGLGAGVSLDFSEAWEGPELRLHAHAAMDRAFARDEDEPLGTLTASIAAEAALGGAMRLEMELRHQRLAASPGELGSPLGRSSCLSLGLGLRPGAGIAVRAGARIAPSDWNPYLPLAVRDAAGAETRWEYRPLPPLSAFLQLAWQGFPLDRDKDHDGVPDGKDLCPSVPEDRDGFQDQDGCPDPDNDRDEVPDASDKCPYVAEDHDGFEDEDGCPEPDNDHDGIPDAQDQCPNDPEDRDGFQDQDGCPDPDDDRDGIPDAADKCPHEAENRNGVEDEDGCPEIDTDHDGIPDPRDKCPREAEIVNFYQDEDGCPDEKPEPVSEGVLEGVAFAGNTAELDSASFPALAALAARLAAYPGTEIEIQAYTDDRAGPGAKGLTQRRAEAVAEHLADLGVESRRLKPVGYGSARPLAPNRTAKGREANRRIQIHRLN